MKRKRAPRPAAPRVDPDVMPPFAALMRVLGVRALMFGNKCPVLLCRACPVVKDDWKPSGIGGESRIAYCPVKMGHVSKMSYGDHPFAPRAIPIRERKREGKE